MRIHVIALAVVSFALFSSPVHAQMMGGSFAADDVQTALEEAEGKQLVERLGEGAVACDALLEEDFERIGEYYMGLMVGDAHAAMNAMMARQLGEAGEEQMHALMGKRLSGCDPDAGTAATAFGSDWFPMMGMMTGISGWGWGRGMMYGGSGWSAVSVVSTLLFWTVCVLAIVALVRSMSGPRGGSGTKGR